MNIIYMYIVYVVYIVTYTGFIGVSVVQGHPPASAAGRPTQPQLGLYLSAGPQPRPPQRLQSADLVLIFLLILFLKSVSFSSSETTVFNASSLD